MSPPTLSFIWDFSTNEFADRFPPALVIWESAAGKHEIRSSILLEIVLKVFHIFSKKKTTPGVSKTLSLISLILTVKGVECIILEIVSLSDNDFFL